MACALWIIAGLLLVASAAYGLVRVTDALAEWDRARDERHGL